MRVVVADTGPLNYLVLIGHVSVLPVLFETVFVPEAVRAELDHPETPPPVRAWIAAPPRWLDIRPSPVGPDADLQALDEGEREAILLAPTLGAELILMDDRAGVAAARGRGLAVTGTLGLLDLAARHGLIDLEAAFARLRATSFRCRPDLFDTILAAHRTVS
ncbi:MULTISPECIES: DUF3368 domain-containing protein [Methylobacterium]|uniref:Nucleic acid-binding protein n=1 Tax=Methylobacterium brachiatum TaxID=269660 RepID=A0AAJ1U2J8_9HYPH|nr:MULTISPECIES: DUF3368 domain-containing protein [Methylobacterium]EIZ84333.1 pin domain nucleic acid-binding protein [Methylobacterium sp. GXF4]MBP32511.1 DUF3368 domain-containing protein [Methylobacterium sp.]MDH2312528.1 DUF3368 domain-containing protein [Methylobacterium brachiatum]MDQ0546798.1 putative nucleic acid-binding protein [Methylobacterium brachiatum]